jgi:hypothetical protein
VFFIFSTIGHFSKIRHYKYKRFLRSFLMDDWRDFKLKKAGVCLDCGKELPIGILAQWSRNKKAVRCLEHATSVEQPTSAPAVFIPPAPLVAPSGTIVSDGSAGASAHKEYERRKNKREDSIRDNHKILGNFIIAVTDTPTSTKVWEKGAVGEYKVGAKLDTLTTNGCHVLHDRKVPKSKANIDHIVVSNSGVYIVDAKNYKGVVKVESYGGVFSDKTYKLKVGGSDRTKLAEGMLWQISVVKNILDTAGLQVPITGVLAFYDAEWPLFGKGIMDIKNVKVTGLKGTVEIITKPGPLTPQQTRNIATALLEVLKPA